MENKNKETKSYVHLGRPACGFYGFVVEFGKMRDTGENQCALGAIIAKPYSSCCQMEIMRDAQNWVRCPLNTKENRIKLAGHLEDIRVYPREFSPAKGKEWGGWTLKIWMRHIADVASEE